MVTVTIAEGWRSLKVQQSRPAALFVKSTLLVTKEDQWHIEIYPALSTSMTIEALLPSHRQVFIDLAGPAYFDDYQDPVYPYVPPTAEETINLLATAPAHSFHTVILSVPNEPRTKSTARTVAALARFLTSPACMDVSTLRIAGSLHLLNERCLQDTLKATEIRTLILQEASSTCDSYALAGLLDALNGITVLHICIDEKQGTSIHRSFQSEVFATLSKLQRLSINIVGDASKTFKDMFRPGTLVACEELAIAFQSREWTHELTSALLEAGSGFPILKSVPVSRWSSDAKRARPCDGTPLVPLLSLPTLQRVDISARNPDGAIEFASMDFLPASLESPDMAYAGPSNPIDLYMDLQGALARCGNLKRISLAHTYPSQEMRDAATSAEWEIVRSSAGLPGQGKASSSVALSRLADTLEAQNVSFRLKLVGRKTHEERAHLAH
ncbi:hypothetical protein P389DRAFT_207694 [Cystobasidium minutum MCA 4210]|uniref:uncharacterized protein n=1 Tax=Cystobasidium minutum MCA 4210 TaxID=1397322 RepID=UPI0034CFF9D6|eukprot:jgi/Rhomi1/207694/estExt_Genemark1.C_1_t20140